MQKHRFWAVAFAGGLGMTFGCTADVESVDHGGGAHAIDGAHSDLRFGKRRYRRRAVELLPLGTYATGTFDGGGAEILDYDSRGKRLWVANTVAGTIDVLDIRDPSFPTLSFRVDVRAYGPRASSVAVHPWRRVAAASIPNADRTLPGKVVFFSLNGRVRSVVEVGSNPDQLVYSPNGRHLLVANEGVPNEAYDVDPEGSVSVINTRRWRVHQSDVRTAGFGAFNDADLDPSVRVFGPGATVAQDLEPEYVTVSKDSRTAWVAMQENNAIAMVDVASAKVVNIVGLGFKDHRKPGFGLDASDRDGAVRIKNWPVWGMYQPDSIQSFQAWGETFLVLANEGDARDWDGFSEETRAGDLPLDPIAFPDAAALQADEALGRLRVSSAIGDDDGDGLFESLYSFGARSISIRRSDGSLVFDSGDQLERVTAEASPDDFNSTNDENGSFDKRSDDKGPEPEGLTVGRIRGRTYVFVGLERIGGIATYDVSNPFAPRLVDYTNTRDFTGDAEMGTAGDLGPEGLKFIPAKKSPIHAPLLAVANEVSGTTTIFKVHVR